MIELITLLPRRARRLIYSLRLIFIAILFIILTGTDICKNPAAPRPGDNDAGSNAQTGFTNDMVLKSVFALHLGLSVMGDTARYLYQ